MQQKFNKELKAIQYEAEVEKITSEEPVWNQENMQNKGPGIS